MFLFHSLDPRSLWCLNALSETAAGQTPIPSTSQQQGPAPKDDVPPPRIDFSLSAENRNQRDDSDPEHSPVDAVTVFSTAPRAHSVGAPAAAALAESPGDAACILVSSTDEGMASANPSSRRRVSWVHVDTEAAAAAAQAAEADSKGHQNAAPAASRHLYGVRPAGRVMHPVRLAEHHSRPGCGEPLAGDRGPGAPVDSRIGWLCELAVRWKRRLAQVAGVHQHSALSFLPCFSLMAALAHSAHTTGGCCRSSLLR